MSKPTDETAAGQPWPRVAEGFTRLTLPVTGAGHHMAGHVTVLCCDDCGSLVGNTIAHRLLCFREERDAK